MDNTRDELLDLIRNATNIDMICFFAIIYVVAPDSPSYTPTKAPFTSVFRPTLPKRIGHPQPLPVCGVRQMIPLKNGRNGANR